MSVYTIGTPHFEYRGGTLFEIQAVMDDSTGQVHEQVTPAEPDSQGGYEGGSDTFAGPNGVIPSDMPRTEGQLPPNDPIMPSMGGRLGDLTGNVGQNANYGAAGPRMDAYGMTPPSNAATQMYGNQGAPMGRENSLSPEQRQQLGLPPAPGGAGAGAGGQTPPGAAPNTAGPGAGNGMVLADYARGLDMYNPENPMVAVENWIQDQGLGRGFGNPMVAFMKKMAKGLALSYIAQNAQTAGVTGDSAAAAPYAFKDYLNNTLGAGAAGAGMAGRGMGQGMNALINTARNLPSLVETVRSLDRDASGNLTGVNPFAETLASMLGSNTGQGTAGFLANLLGPAMPHGLGEAYTAGLDARTRTAQRAKYGIGPGGPTAGTPMGEGDIWTYLLGAK